MKTPVQFRHNGSDDAVFVDGGANLLVALRDGVGDTSPKFGCGQGTCGVCTVAIDTSPSLIARITSVPPARKRAARSDCSAEAASPRVENVFTVIGMISISQLVMPGHSPSNTGINALMPGIHVFLSRPRQSRGWPGLLARRRRFAPLARP